MANMKIIFKYGSDYRYTHASGVIGSPTPDGLVMCHFYTERPVIPAESEIEVTGGPLQQVKQQFKIEALEREAQFGIAITPSKARNIAEFLLKSAAEAEAIAKAATRQDD